ncbi:hypothetical protein AB0L53_49460 [Nonomuraea sp. NPDC052129]|uniref:hypothetical protein n=1 Tax=Nonomuraea sp. NPDC052129 TaxID=3154651 RepID=UPI00343A680A
MVNVLFPHLAAVEIEQVDRQDGQIRMAARTRGDPVCVTIEAIPASLPSVRTYASAASRPAAARSGGLSETKLAIGPLRVWVKP